MGPTLGERLHLYVASPSRPLHWVKMLLRLITRRAKKDDHVEVWSGTRAEIRLNEADAYELDGDVAGDGVLLRAEVDPGSLRMRMRTRAPHRGDEATPNAS